MERDFFSYSSYRDILSDEFSKRRSMNSAYSLRAFARDLGLTSGQLSEVLNEVHGLSSSKAEMIGKSLGLSKTEKLFFSDLVAAQDARSKKGKLDAQNRLKAFREKKQTDHFQELSLDLYQAISDWHYYAILELTYLEGFQSDEAWIAKRLGLKKVEVKKAIERLRRLGLLEEKDGVLKDSQEFLAGPSGIPSEAIKKHHQQILKKASEALTQQKVDERDFSSVILSFDQVDLDEAKEMMKDFRRKFVERFSKKKKKNSVYTLSTQFFSLDQNCGSHQNCQTSEEV